MAKRNEGFSMDEARLVMDSFPGVYICWKDKESKFRGCNKNFAELFHNTPESFVGTQDSQSQHVKDDQEVLRTQKPKLNLYEYITLPDGEKMPILTQKGPWFNEQGEIIGIVVCFIKDPRKGALAKSA